MTDFSYTGSYQTYVVPSGVTTLRVNLEGGAGGDEYFTASGGDGGQGGFGGKVVSTITVTPGETLRIYVGGKGGDGAASVAGAGAFGHGADGAYVHDGAPSGRNPPGGGGGSTDIRRSPYGLADRLAVAGGGGGSGGNNGSDGAGDGGNADADGVNGFGGGGLHGSGATTSAGGAGGAGTGALAGTDGTLADGGPGGATGIRGGGGGGGGLYGGGGGAGTVTSGTGGGGGGGGSSATTGTLIGSIGLAATRTDGFASVLAIAGGFHLGKKGFGAAAGLR